MKALFAVMYGLEYQVRWRGPGKGHLEVVDGMFKKCYITYHDLKAISESKGNPFRPNKSVFYRSYARCDWINIETKKRKETQGGILLTGSKRQQQQKNNAGDRTAAMH